MLCQMCKEHQATVHIVRVVNGVKQELNICDSCAKSTGGFGLSGNMKMETPFTFQNILGGFMDYINQPAHNVKNVETSCPNCGMTPAEFRQKGLVGCSNCYKYYNFTMESVIKRVQANLEHVGKIPLKAGRDIVGKKQLAKLKEELQKAVLSEEYEKAAQLRDKIREFQKGE